MSPCSPWPLTGKSLRQLQRPDQKAKALKPKGQGRVKDLGIHAVAKNKLLANCLMSQAKSLTLHPFRLSRSWAENAKCRASLP